MFRYWVGLKYIEYDHAEQRSNMCLIINSQYASNIRANK